MDWLINVVPVLLTLIGGGAGWLLKSKLETKRRIEESLQEEAAQIYLGILLPFATLFSDLSLKSQAETLKKIKSCEYREKSFKLVLVGSDEVVSSWNSMWSTIYAAERREGKSTDILVAFGNVLLAIRRSLGNSATSMSNKDLLKWLIKDIDMVKSNV
ncbi:hypothetical protein FM042_10440 [Aliidiomarina halalkaliphila]|uniref:Uncharacterized protein n=1 Tax=Aliidiomarina halalkaliphila TaxID=2593535 RepID=A0A552WZR1_9GAMM|nr:hypothetical protein [Aliidiomarina halalkaliphila]TRW48069.1 hypothetical protein FM042_10440 [Aliidiomarina halalkaliphila]